MVEQCIFKVEHIEFRFSLFGGGGETRSLRSLGVLVATGALKAAFGAQAPKGLLLRLLLNPRVTSIPWGPFISRTHFVYRRRHRELIAFEMFSGSRDNLKRGVFVTSLFKLVEVGRIELPSEIPLWGSSTRLVRLRF